VVLAAAQMSSANGFDPDKDPSLAGCWKLDETSGTTASDSSGRNNHGTIYGNPVWIEGRVNGALRFDGSGDYVSLPIGAVISSLTDCTLAIWVNFPNTGGAWQRIFDIGTGTNVYMLLSPRTGTTGPLRFAITIGSYSAESLVSAPSTLASGWHHVAVVMNAAAMNMQLYLDGNVVATAATLRLAKDLGNTTQNWLGRSQYASDAYFTGSLDDFRIYSRVLSQAEIRKLIPPLVKARDPSPANGALINASFVTMTWTAGDTAASHDVYFGENRAAVQAGTGGTFRGNQTATWYIVGAGLPGDPVPGGLQVGKTYYWRIDEVETGGTKHTGAVWSFTLPPKTAYNPVPADGRKFIDLNADLSWTAGANAKLHYVYIGTDFNTVNSASGGVFQAATTFEPGPLAADTTYYWRVDEFDGANTHTGLVWSFRTIPNITVTDPNLVGWWKLDEGEGTLALDWSGHGNHGTIYSGATWQEGFDGGALRFDGLSGYVALPIGATISTLKSATITTWVNFSNEGGAWQRIFDFGNGTAVYMFLTPRTETTGPMRFAITTAGGDSESLIDAPSTLASGWHHVAVVINGATKNMYLYLDGVVVGSAATQVLPSDLGNPTQNWLGRSQWAADAYFDGSLDDFRIYDYAMAAGEIPKTMRGDPKLAWGPEPTDNAVADIREVTALKWSKGDTAIQHDVYFGANLNAVTNATAGSAEYKGQQSVTTWSLAGKIEFGGGPYYWRIDEINSDSTINKGRVWRFSIADYFVIDNMEDYNNFPPDRIFETWIDGYGNSSVNGSIVGHPDPDFDAGEDFAERSIFRSGQQSMPYYYNCNFKYSEAVMTLANPNRDWTQQGVKSLSLWFRGYPATQGSLTEAPAGTFTMTGAGSDIWIVNSVEADEFHYAWKMLNGPGTITAKVSAITGTNLNGWAKAGLMIRESLDPNSAHAHMLLSATNGIALQYRPTAGGTSANAQQKTTISNRPLWLRLDRAFDGTFTASHANDVTGAPDKWTAMTTTNIQMAANVYIGLALTSHQAYVQAQATFSNITLAGTITGATWTDQDIGIRSNQAERMFVAIQGTTGPQAIVYHTDPQAVLRNTWTEWNIPLTAFTGINLSNVDRISIGFGTRGNTSPGGSGLVYFDDIRLYKARCMPTLLKPVADLNNNCVVDMADLKLLANDWLKTGAALASDLDQSQKVDFKDYNALAETWLEEKLWP
jgi:hypothetical protein